MTEAISNHPAAVSSLRDWLDRLDSNGRLARAKPGIPLEYTLAAIAKRLDGEKAVLFPEPGGHPVSVISGIVSQRAWIAEAMGSDDATLLDRFRDAVLNPLPWTEVDEAPVQEIVHRNAIDLKAVLPIPIHNEHDNGAYITAGLVIARNPQTGDHLNSATRPAPVP
jgi:2,5-furandicarboxylate decarboxylase 1